MTSKIEMKDDCSTPEGDKAGIEYRVELWGKYYLLVPEEFNEWPPRGGMRLEKVDFWDSDRPGFPPESLSPIPKMELSLTQEIKIDYKPFGGR